MGTIVRVDLVTADALDSPLTYEGLFHGHQEVW